jgi:cation transport ATPase
MKTLIAWHQQHQSASSADSYLSRRGFFARLILTWTGMADAVPFDLAWFAVVFCGLPIVIGALIGLIKDHDVTADVLVSMALIGCLVFKNTRQQGKSLSSWKSGRSWRTSPPLKLRKALKA